MPLVIDPNMPPPRTIPLGVAACVWLNPMLLVGFILLSVGRHTAVPVYNHWRATGRLAVSDWTTEQRRSDAMTPRARVRSIHRNDWRFAAAPPPSIQNNRTRIDEVKFRSKQKLSEAVFCLLLPLFGLFLGGCGVRLAYRQLRFLRNGELGIANIVRCKPKVTKSASEYEFCGLTVKTSKNEVLSWMPMAQFQLWANSQREAAAAKWKRLNELFARFFATFAGGLFGAMAGAAIGIVTNGAVLV